MEIAGVIILEAGEKVLVKLCEELCSIFDAELVTFVLLKVNQLEKRENRGELHQVWIEAKACSISCVLEADHEALVEALFQADHGPD